MRAFLCQINTPGNIKYKKNVARGLYILSYRATRKPRNDKV